MTQLEYSRIQRWIKNSGINASQTKIGLEMIKQMRLSTVDREVALSAEIDRLRDELAKGSK